MEHHVEFVEKRMMGGLCFMVNDKMCIGLDIDKDKQKDRLMVRLDPQVEQEALKRKGAKPMDFTGRPMKGYVFVDEGGFQNEKDLNYWIQLAIDFNPKAKVSKKRNK